MADNAIVTLSAIEANKLARNELIIRNGLATFYAVGGALLEIRDERQYRATHSTFEEYCQERWNMKRAQAYRLIEASEVINRLSPIGDIIPTNEAQTRELAKLPDEDQVLAWQAVIATAPGGNVTASHVKAVAETFAELRQTGALDNGEGESLALSEIVKTNVIESAYERMKRQEIHIAENAKKLGPLMSSDSSEWYTTPDIIQAVIAVMGAIDLDPCSNSHDNPNVPAAQHYTKEDDGLAQEWRGRLYVNPPFGNDIPHWVDKLVYEYLEKRTTQAILLAPARTDTHWFRALRNFPRCFMFGRVKFNGNANSAPFPTMLVGVGCDRNKFVEVMSALGDVYERIGQ